MEIKLMQKTVTSWDDPQYMNILLSAILMSNSMNRSADKPMAALADKFDSHLCFRLVHEISAALIMKRLAEGLNLNGDLAYAGMLMHDVGHPFSAHDGEEIFTSIGKLYNCGYFHHNAKGIEVIRRENILETALAMIPNIEHKPELRERLERDFDYFLDIVISHDGEADPKDLTKLPQEYSSIREAIEDKLRRSNTQNDYKFVSQTPEGMLAKYADVIAYLSSDVRDGFRLGILKNFNNQFLSIFGRIVATSRSAIKDDKDAIEIAKDEIKRLQEKHLEETESDIEDPNNKKLIEIAKKIRNEIKNNGINTYILSSFYEEDTAIELGNNNQAELFEIEKEKAENKINEILQKHLEQYVAERLSDPTVDKREVKNALGKITDYVNKMLYVNTMVVKDVTNKIQEFFIEDLITNTRNLLESNKKAQEKGETPISVPLLSEYAADLYKKAKNFGYTFYVPHVKTKYQKELLPKNVQKIVEDCSRRILESGILDDRLSDVAIKNKIPQEKLEVLEIENYEEDLRTIASKTTIKGRYTADKKNKRGKFDIVAKVEDSIKKQGTRLAKVYEHCYEAIEHQIKSKVNIALSHDYKYRERTSCIDVQYEDEIKKMREKYLSMYPELACNTTDETKVAKQEELKERITTELIKTELKKIKEKMAIQISMDYISGMTDEGIKDLAIDLNFMTQDEYNKAQQERGGEATDQIKKLQAMTK